MDLDLGALQLGLKNKIIPGQAQWLGHSDRMQRHKIKQNNNKNLKFETHTSVEMARAATERSAMESFMVIVVENDLEVLIESFEFLISKIVSKESDFSIFRLPS